MYKIISNNKQPLLKNIQNSLKRKSLISAFIRRDFKIEFAQTYIGIAWLLFQPILSIIVYTLFFDNIIKLDTNDIPYPVFVFTGILFWQYFVYVALKSSSATIGNQNIISKIPFPKLTIIIAKPLTGFIPFVVNLLILISLLFYYGIAPTLYVLFFPVLLLLIYLTGFTISLWINAISYRYRDFVHLLNTLIGYAIWITPVFYPATIIPDKFSFIVYLNPIAGIINWFRYTIFGGNLPSPYYFIGTGIMICFFFSGLIIFNKIEHKLADKL